MNKKKKELWNVKKKEKAKQSVSKINIAEREV